MGTPAAFHISLVVLIVEDDFLIREEISSEIMAAGFVALQAESGEVAISTLHAGRPVDVLFTDIQLGGKVSGWDVAETFRRVRPELPVIYASGNASDRHRRVENSEFFDKPYRPCEVVQSCKKLARGKSL